MTINVISLFGMIIVIGILVDDGIVIAENIYDQYESGKTKVQAAIDGTMQVVPPIIAAILTTIIAFSTFLFLPERLGSFFGQIAKVVGIILAISLIEAFLILPAHLAHSRALDRNSKPFILNIWADKGIGWIRDNLYVPVLRFVLNYQIFGFAIPIALLLFTVGAMQGGVIRFTFFPNVASDRPASVVSNLIRQKVGPIYEAESVVYGSGNAFGGKPVSVSLVGNNIRELKQAKEDLKAAFRSNSRLADVTDNDPAGIKEIKINLKENAYLLGRFQRGRDEIRVWVRYDRSNRSSITDLDRMRIVTPSGNRVPLAEIAKYEIERGDVVKSSQNILP